MNFAAGLCNLTVLLIAYLAQPHMTRAFSQTPNTVAHNRIKRGSFFSDIKHLGQTVFDNAKDKYEEPRLMPIDYVNAEKFCRSLGVDDRQRNMHCVQDLTHNFVIGSVLSLFRGNASEDKPSRREFEFKKHDSSSRSHRPKSGRGAVSVAFQERLTEFVSNANAAKKEIKDVSKAIRRLRKTEEKDD